MLWADELEDRPVAARLLDEPLVLVRLAGEVREPLAVFGGRGRKGHAAAVAAIATIRHNSGEYFVRVSVTSAVTVPGNGTWPAVMGHYVPQAKVGSVGPGVKLAVAVNMADKMNEVAIDWDQSPLP